MTAGQSNSQPVRPPHRRWIAWAVLGLAALITLLHGRAVNYGLFMDDYAHYRQLRECGWSLGELADACRLELVGGVIDIWWLPECTLRFFRPVSFGLMKLTYTLSDWSPVAAHVVSLCWHLAACTLLMLLLRRLGARRGLSFGVAALFALHPGHVATVQWIASQTELIVTTLLLASLLCYAEFRGWPNGDGVSVERSPRARWTWGVAGVTLFAFALGCRENAIMLPFVVLTAEPLVRRQWRRPALFMYAILGITAGVYLGVRSYYLGGAALPPRPYIIPPTDPDFFRFALDKACYYMMGEFLLVPAVPLGGLAYLRDHPLLFYGSASLLILTIAMLFWTNRRRVAGWLGPACLLGFMAPVLPAFESPHHLYLPGVGWAILAMLLVEKIAGVSHEVPARSVRWREPLSGAIVITSGLVFGVTTHFFGLSLDTAQAVEDRVVEEIATAPRPVEDGDTLYIANLPMIAHYTQLAVEERTGKRDLRVVALTWSPRLLGMTAPCELTQVDERTIDVRVAENSYFSGPSGLLVEQSAGKPLAEVLAGPLTHEHFSVEVLEMNADGVSALHFAFERPICQTGMHLFWGSQSRWAYQVPPERDGKWN